jgi:predicted RecA/RadA family phage recombinase
MARTFIGAGRRRSWVPTLGHKAGDLVYHQGFFGVSNDDAAFSSSPTAADRPFVQILDGVWDLPRVFQGANIVSGARVYAYPTHDATSLILYPGASLPAGAVPIGRLMATYTNGASYARVVLFGPENQHTAL